MGGVILWKYCAWLALFSSPAIPLAFAWRWLLKDARLRKPGTLVPAAIASLSLVWFDAAVANYRFVGPLYSRVRYVVTGGNLGLALLCALFCLVTSFFAGARAARIVTALACLLLAVEWALLGIAYR
ncbi:MAG: hypothetical protein WBE38_02910 [Terracidiphilus sp.]